MDLLNLHLRASDYGCLPSDILQIEHAVVAYAFDHWCGLFGRKVLNLLEEREPIRKQNQIVGYKPKYTLARALEKAAGDKQSRMRGFAEIFARLSDPHSSVILQANG